ncbi:MAG: cyanophycinase [Planctomycetota bacterium]
MHNLVKLIGLFALLPFFGGGAFFWSINAEAQDFTRYLTGSAGDADVQAQGGLLLAGGGTDVDAAMTWFRTRANGGDIVILRASGSDGYNDYLFDELPGPAIDSVETFVFENRNAASNPQVLQSVNQAEAIFFAGGDQSNYDDFWRGTPLEDAIHQRIADGAVIGGTSAGLAILGSSAYVAQDRSLRSNRALANPYHPDVTLEHDFLQLPLMQGVLTDSHFTQRDREGRLLTMMARSAEETNTPIGFRGIGVNDQTAVVVEPDGSAMVLANGTTERAAHLFTTTQAASQLTPGTPLTFENIAALEVRANERFNFHTFTAEPGVGRAYSYDIIGGQLQEDEPIVDAPDIPGDFDASNTVDQADLNLVLNNWGQPHIGWNNAEGLETDTVDQEELNRVLENWGISASPAMNTAHSQSTPEPAAAAALLGLLGVAARPAR